MGGGALSSNVSKLVGKEVRKKLRNFPLTSKKACHCEDERSEDVAIAKSLNINEITTQSTIARNDTIRHAELVSASHNETVFSRFTSHFSRKRVAFTLAEGATHVDTCDGKRKIAFTLAEVLITLGVIGVVASLTLPSVITSYKNQVTVAKLQKAYSILNQAYQNSIADNGPAENWQESNEIGVKEYFNKYWRPYFKDIKDCNSRYRNCGYVSQPFKYLSGTKCSFALAVSRPFFKTNDDIFFMFTNDTTDSIGNYVAIQYIFVDVNGSKAPNVFGKDVFLFERVFGKGILPLGHDKSVGVVNSECSLNREHGGMYCAQKIMNDSWKINYLK